MSRIAGLDRRLRRLITEMHDLYLSEHEEAGQPAGPGVWEVCREGEGEKPERI